MIAGPGFNCFKLTIESHTHDKEREACSPSFKRIDLLLAALRRVLTSAPSNTAQSLFWTTEESHFPGILISPNDFFSLLT